MDFEFTPVDSIDKVPEQFRGIYKQGDDGKFIVDDTYKGVVEAITGLNKSLKAARAEAKAKTPVDLSPLADYGRTPEEIKATVESRINELQEQVAKGGDAKVNLEKIKQDLAAAHAKDLEKANKRSEALQNQLYGLLVENAATAAVVELKGVPELLLPFLKQQVKVVEEEGEFKVFVVDAQGDQRYSGVTGQPMTIKELVAEMKANEKFGRLFESEAPAGGGMPPRGGSTPPRQPGRVLSANEKIAAGLAKGQFKAGRGRA